MRTIPLSPLLRVLPGAVLLSTTGLRAQCAKPVPPSLGFPTTYSIDNPLTYADGYKTLVNLTWPTTGKPACGWPLVVFVHGYSGKRSIQRGLASQGFAVATFDVRGQGDAKKLNPPTMGMTFYGATEKYDLAEVVAFVRKKWRGLVDPNKLAVTGGSQGGIHSWFAAAYSGRTITIKGRGTIAFPKVDCAVPRAFIPDAIDHMLRGGTLFSMDALERFLTFTSAVLDPSLKTRIRTAFVNQDPISLYKWLTTDPDRAVTPYLLQSTVPVRVHMAYTDGIQTPHELVHIVQQRKSLTTMTLSTGGHGSPGNWMESLLVSEERLRFLDRYLWGIRNGVELEARSTPGIMPLLPAAWSSVRTLWSHRYDSAFPPKDVKPARVFLSAAGGLVWKPPTPGSPTILTHKVTPGYTPSVFLSSKSRRTDSVILSKIPLSRRIFKTAPLASEIELCGNPRLSLHVTPTTNRYTIHGQLFATVPGSTKRMFLAGWARGLLGRTPRVGERVAITLSPIACVLPKKTVLELEVQNHWIREYPNQKRIVTAPYFVSGSLSIAHGSGTTASWLELPVRARRGVGLVADRVNVFTSKPLTWTLGIRGGAARAGKVALCLLGLSGRAPGLPLPGGTLPVKPDASTWVFISLANSPFLPGFVSVLDARGEAAPRVVWSVLGGPLPTVLRGRSLECAAYVFDGPGLSGTPSNPVSLRFR